MASSPNLDKLRALTGKLNARDQKLDLNAFFDMALDMLCIANRDGYFIKLNPAWESLGWDIEELQSQPFIEFVHPDDHHATIEAFQKITLNGSVSYFRNRYRCKDGSYKILCWTGVKDPNDKLIYMVVRDFDAMMEKLCE